METQRTFEDLALELYTAYGNLAGSIYDVYNKHNPLKLPDTEINKYWEKVRVFLEKLHLVLHTENHQLSISKIQPESYFFLVKLCIDYSLTITELIDVRNDTSVKHTKNMANDIAHYILPPYLTYRRQIQVHNYRHLVTPGQVPQEAYMFQPYPQYPLQTPYPPYPPYPLQSPYTYPSYPLYPIYPQPMHQQQQQYLQSFPANSAQSNQPKIKPVVKVKPHCIQKGKEKKAHMIPTISISDTDTIPLNFYNVYCASKSVDLTMSYYLPQIMPVSNRPPPP